MYQGIPGKPEFKSALSSRGEEKREAEKLRDLNWRRTVAAVKVRDRGQCRACHKPGTDPHHIIRRGKHRIDSTDNVCLLCRPCHDDIKLQRLFISGNANGRLKIERPR